VSVLPRERCPDCLYTLREDMLRSGKMEEEMYISRSMASRLELGSNPPPRSRKINKITIKDQPDS
jgi:hypothetical protein